MARPRGVTAPEALAALRARLVGLDGVEAPVIVGCSGGPDSLALLALACDAGLHPVAVHVDHGLRPASEQEALLVAEHAARLGAQIRAETVRVKTGPNVEARAREARYAALEHARSASEASVVLVGHTADDQAETILLNFLRGSGSQGLAGMAVRRGTIVRPMLELRRRDTEALCAALGLEPLRDPTNEDTKLRRNLLRHELLPAIERASERDIVPVLTRQASVLRDESEYLDALARVAWPIDDATPAKVLAAMPPVLARRAVRQWLGPPPPSLDEVTRVLAVARGEIRATEVAGGRRVARAEGRMSVVDPE